MGGGRMGWEGGRGAGVVERANQPTSQLAGQPFSQQANQPASRQPAIRSSAFSFRRLDFDFRHSAFSFRLSVLDF